jgi:hypothetical protein
MLNLQIASSLGGLGSRIGVSVWHRAMITHLRHLIPIPILMLSVTAAWRAQVPGYAEITNPGLGQALTGVVTIEGTASHPSFQAYGISFAYDPNPTNTWFPIGDRVATAVSASRLAVWDTSGLTPGTYQLRLTVYLEDGKILESTVGGLQIGQQPSKATPTSPASATSVPLADSQPAQPPQVGGQVLSTQPTPGDNLLRVLKVGAFSAIGALLLLGAYAGLRPKVRSYLGSIQNRRLDPRRRSRRRGDRS